MTTLQDTVVARDEAPRMVTRGELCTALGISKTTLRRWEVAGKVPFVVTEKGVHLFPEEHVKKLLGPRELVHLPRARMLAMEESLRPRV